MAGRYTRTLKDYNGEDSNVQVYATVLSDTNFAAQITLQSNFGAAINNITTGSLQTIKYGNQIDSNNPAPVDTWSQRELKWKVNYRDTVTNKEHYFTVPTADTSVLDPNNKGFANIGDAGPVDAFVAAAEAYVLSEAGNPIEVLNIPLVGRNI